MNNDDKLREQMKSEPVPDRLRPENIKIMLDNEAPKKKRSGISVAGRMTAAAAAFAVIGGTAAYTMNNGKFNRNKEYAGEVSSQSGTSPTATTLPVLSDRQVSYMSGARSYEEVYTLFGNSAKKAKRNSKKYSAIYDEQAVESAMPVYEADDADKATMTVGEFKTEFNSADDPTPVPTVPPSSVLPTESYTEPYTEIITEPATDPVEDPTEPITEDPTEPVTEDPTEPTTDDPEYSDTYYQEQDVLEADIVKTDGKRIYYVCTDYHYDYVSAYQGGSLLHVADVEDGKFTGNSTVNINEVLGVSNEDKYSSLEVCDMYIYNDMIAIIGTVHDYNSYYYNSGDTFAAFFTTGDEPELIDVYRQDGNYTDVRISPDGYMLLTSTYSSYNYDEIGSSIDTDKYIPCCGFSEDFDCIPPEDILLPSDGFEASEWLSYSVIGSIDLNESGAPAAYDTKTLAGYSGSIYCSADNLYTAAGRWGDTGNTTDITRISIKGGNIVPQAGTTINGTVKDQFSMSEYGGYFRVAASYTEEKETYHSYDYDEGVLEGIWNRIKGEQNGYYTYELVNKDCRVYVFDMDMELVGSVDGLGVNEDIKSASFSGDMAYIVTFRQTDPLYAVDLSDPSNPVVLDELKINGFSTYMQSWGDGLLLGFGQDADENGRITGLRLTMFDNSDPNDLKAADVYTWNNEYKDGVDLYYSSIAVSERKALLIAPEKNLIGVPVYVEDYKDYDDYKMTTKYEFFSFEDGQFVRRGEISFSNDAYDYQSLYERALYIGNYVYALSSQRFVAADINTLEITDEIDF